MTIPFAGSLAGDALTAQLNLQLENMLIAAVGTADSVPAQLQQALQSLPSGQTLTISGTFAPPSDPAATSQTANSQIAGPQTAILQTAAGPLSLTLNTQPPGGTVAAQLQPSGAGIVATIMLARSSAPLQTASLNGAPATSPSLAPSSNLSQAVASPPALQSGAVITGRLISPVPDAGAAIASAPAVTSSGNFTSVKASAVPEIAVPISTIISAPALSGPGPVLSLPGVINNPILAAQEESTPTPLSASMQTTPPPAITNAAYVVISIDVDVDASSLAILSAEPAPVPAVTPSQTGAQSPQLPIQAPVQASVLASTPNGQPILALPTGTLLVNEPATVKIGATLTLLPLDPAASENAVTENSATIIGAGAAPLPLPLASAGKTTWPALSQTLELLTRLAPGAASALQTIIPQLDRQIGPQSGTNSPRDFVSSFISYLNAGQSTPSAPNSGTPVLQTALASTPLSETDVKNLRGALTQVVADFFNPATSPSSQQVSGQIFGQWQNYPVPVMTGTELAMLQLYVRQQAEPEDEQDKNKSKKDKRRQPGGLTRFLVEIHPGALGPVQLDGLVRKNRYQDGSATNPQLDLIVRSEAPLAPEAISDMGIVYDRALGATGLVGHLTFQIGRESFVQPESAATHAYNRKV